MQVKSYAMLMSLNKALEQNKFETKEMSLVLLP